jgi:HlyD family secretion protein
MMRKIFSKKYVKITAGIIIIAVVGALIYNSQIAKKKAVATNAAMQKTAAVKKGDIEIGVSGSGNIYYDKNSDVTSKVGSTITKVYFKEGDRVKTGDLIAEFDDTDAVISVNQKKNALVSSQLSSSANAEEISKLIVKTPFSGQVSSIAVKKGDTVQKGSALFTIADTSKLKLSVEFNSADIEKISVNQPVEVYITSMMQAVPGTVSYKSNKAVSTSLGGQLYSVEIQISNPGAVSEGMTANVSLETAGGTLTSTNTAALEYVNKTIVLSEASGTIDNVSIKKNQQVNTEEAVIKIKNNDVLRNKEIGDLKISDSKLQIEASEKQLSYYKVYAPIDGIIAKQSIKAGDSVIAGQIVTTIKETNVVQADIDIDELDIAKVAVGQKVKLTVDALPETTEKPIEGEVVKISLDGTAKNGVTNFPVTVRVNERQDLLKGGMNITAEIQVGSAVSVLYVPKAAVTKSNGKSTVMLAADKATIDAMKKEGKKTTDNAVSKEVEVGVSNGSIIEIKNGLKDGEVVILP